MPENSSSYATPQPPEASAPGNAHDARLPQPAEALPVENSSDATQLDRASAPAADLPDPAFALNGISSAVSWEALTLGGSIFGLPVRFPRLWDELAPAAHVIAPEAIALAEVHNRANRVLLQSFLSEAYVEAGQADEAFPLVTLCPAEHRWE